MFKQRSNQQKSKYNHKKQYFSRIRKLSEDDRMVIGISMKYCGRKGRRELVRSFCAQYGISRSRCYQIKDEVEGTLASTAFQVLPPTNRASDETIPALIMNEDLKKRIILCLHTEGKCSNSVISRFFEEALLQDDVSSATVSKVVKEAGLDAVSANETLDRKAFPKIKAIAMDEIFQGRQPILTVVDLDTTYVLLIEPEKDRKGETWEIQSLIMQEYGLDPDLVISDACGAILMTIPKAFGEGSNQLDVFHALKGLSDVLFSFLRHVDGLINEEGELQDRIKNKKTQQRTKEKLAALQKVVSGEVDKADQVEIAYEDIVELLAFSGYTVQETTELIKVFIGHLQEIFKNENCARCQKREQCQKCQSCTRKEGCSTCNGRICMNCPSNKGCMPCKVCNRCPHPDECKVRNGSGKTLEALETFLKNLPATLQFLEKFFDKLAILDRELPEMYEGLHAEVYALWRYKKGSAPWWSAYSNLVEEYGELIVRRAYANVADLTKTTKRASSLVECLNSRIRPMINSKRRVSKRHMELLKLKFNTRVYKRSRIDERVGKSPIELVTGEQYDFYELLGIGKPLIIQVPDFLTA